MGRVVERLTGAVAIRTGGEFNFQIFADVDGADARVALHEARNVLRHHEVRLHLAQLKSRHHR